MRTVFSWMWDDVGVQKSPGVAGPIGTQCGLHGPEVRAGFLGMVLLELSVDRAVRVFWGPTREPFVLGEDTGACGRPGEREVGRLPTRAEPCGCSSERSGRLLRVRTASRRGRRMAFALGWTPACAAQQPCDHGPVSAFF